MTSAPLDPLARCLEPISMATPAGCDVRLEPEHELLRSEIAKLGALHAAVPNWPLVASVGLELLGTRSKDLLVAVYVACALAVTDPGAGAAQGAALITSLLLRFGSLLFPLRERARVSALEWYLAWLEARLEVAAPSPQVDVAPLLESLLALREAALVQLGAAAPSFAQVLRSCERSMLASSPVARAGAETHPPATPAATPAVERGALPVARDDQAATRGALARDVADPPRLEPVGAARAAPGALADPARSVAAGVVATPTLGAQVEPAGTAADAARYVLGPPPEAPAQLKVYVARAGALLVELARTRFAHDRTDPRAYRWLRTGSWLCWEQAPPSHRRGRCELDAPSPSRQRELAKAVAAEAWPGVLGLSEQLLCKHPLWLDSNRWSALALAKLGDGFAVAREQVVRETRAVLHRMPELATLSFSDGTPFASSETLAWLSHAGGSACAEPARETTRTDASLARGTGACLGVPAPTSGALSESLRAGLLQGDRAAIAELDELLRTSRSLRSAFLLRLELAGALERAGQVSLAVTMYLGLERDLDAFQLERWEPALALQVLSPLWRLLSTVEARGSVAAREPRHDGVHGPAERIGARLAQLSPTALL